MNTSPTTDTMRKKIKTGDDEEEGEEVIRSSECDSALPDLPLDVMWDVFTGLPIWKVFQCLCVSKVWRSILRSHQFIAACRSSNPCCLVLSFHVFQEEEGYKFSVGHSIEYCPLLVSSASAPSEPSPQPFVNLFGVSFLDEEPSNNIPIRDYNRKVTQVVNGLFCCPNGEDHQLFLCNIFTSESMRLSAPRPVDVGFSFPSAYYLGFDPIKGLYKLLMIRKWLSAGSAWYDYRVGLEILTLGTDSSWRELRCGSDVLRCFKSGPKLGGITCVNGVLYWTNRSDVYLDVYSFDLNKEKFGNPVRLPVRLSFSSSYPRFCLVQDGGRPCVLFWIEGNAFLFVIGDDEICNIYKLSLPKELEGVDDFTFLPVGNLPSGEILLAIQKSGSSSTLVYAYDHKTVKLESIDADKVAPYLKTVELERNVVGKLPPKTTKLQSIDVAKVPPDIRLEIFASCVSCQEQNIAPLEAIIRSERV